MLAIINATAVLSERVLEGATVLVDGGRIIKIGTDTEIPEGAEIIDLGGDILGPGFVDIHVHGGGGAFFYENPQTAAEHFLSHGETTVLPTLYYDLDKEELLRAVHKLCAVIESGECPSIAGLYMEGPYMNPKYGASPEKNKWRGEIKREDYEKIVEAAGERARVWVVAPEREGIEDFVRFVKEINPKAVISMGHSEATLAEVEALKPYGLTLMTHCMNATGRIPTEPGTRACGPDEACLIDRDMYAEMICDSEGIHVGAEMQKFLLTIKGEDRIVLISDSFVSLEEVPEHLKHITDLSFDANGGLSGSRLTLDVALKNLVKHTGVSLASAFKMASTNPARAMGLDSECGEIAVGKRANFVILDNNLNTRGVILDGRKVR